MAQAQAAKVIGVMRFSVLTPTYFSERFDSLDKIADHIFNPERMALRFHIFESLVLPSLITQTDRDFDLVVLTAERMPAEYKDRLASLIAAVPNLHLREVGTDNHYQLLKDGYDSIPLDGASHRLMFRLDDDDALDRNYVRRLKKVASVLKGMHRREVLHVISFNRGFYVRMQEGGNEVFDSCERAPLSAGTALLASAKYPRNPYRYNHRQLAQYYNSYSDITVPSFIRTIHGDNKSNPAQMGLTHQMRPKTMAAELIKHFGIDLDVLRQL